MASVARTAAIEAANGSTGLGSSLLNQSWCVRVEKVLDKGWCGALWATVRDMAIQHWKFEEEKETEDSDAVIMSPQPVKRARTGMGSMMSQYMEAAGEGQSDAAEGTGQSVQTSKDMLDAAIQHYQRIPCVDENSDPLLFWKEYDVPGSALEVHSNSANLQLP